VQYCEKVINAVASAILKEARLWQDYGWCYCMCGRLPIALSKFCAGVSGAGKSFNRNDR